MVALNLTQRFASPDYWLASLKVKGAREKGGEGLQKYLYIMYINHHLYVCRNDYKRSGQLESG